MQIKEAIIGQFGKLQNMSLGMHLPITVVPCDFWWMENHFI